MFDEIIDLSKPGYVFVLFTLSGFSKSTMQHCYKSLREVVMLCAPSSSCKHEGVLDQFPVLLTLLFVSLNETN